jgi:rhamnosyltransferase
VTFDQDSQPEKGMVTALWEAHLRNPRAAVVGPCIIESARRGRPYRWVRRHPRWRWLFQRVNVQTGDLLEVTEVITSGSMVELATSDTLGGFDEALFIDYVDVDYCLRVGRVNRSVMVAAAARLQHRLGARRPARLLGKDFRPMHHPAFRHYYMARNRVRVWRRHAIAVPHWAVFDFCFAVFNGFRVLAFERNKWAKLKAITLGTWDGLRGRTGPCPVQRSRTFEA